MAGILGNDDSLASKAAQLAQSVVGDDESTGVPTVQILLHDFHLRGIPPKAGIAGAMQELKTGLKMYRQHNTIMAIKKLSPVVAQAHFFTMDPEPVFGKLVTEWVDKLRQAGGKVIYDTVADPHIIRALQKAGAQIQQPDSPKFKLKALI